MKDLIVAIDGYSSCGKSSMARDIAKDLGYIYIDTGAMYRAVTWFAIKNNLIENGKILETELKNNLSQIEIRFLFNKQTLTNDTVLNGENVENEIRMPVVADQVSLISTLPFVREHLVSLQQKMGENKNIVMDGRDIGTVVFPDAEVKLFMTADPMVRAKRRYAELLEKGIKTSVEEVFENLKQRDYTDENRETSPLRKAKDAIVIDNTNLTRKEQLEMALNIIREKANEG